MNRHKKTTVISAVILFLAVQITLQSCATKLPPPTEFESAPLMGMVYNADGMPVYNAAITIDTSPGPSTDINGRFIIPDLQSGIHRISIEARDYEPATVDFAFLNKSQIMYVRLYNAQQLLNDAETALESLDYNSAHELIDRALALNEQYHPALYLKAILYYKQEEYSKSEELLVSMINSGQVYPEVDELLSMVRDEKQKKM